MTRIAARLVVLLFGLVALVSLLSGTNQATADIHEQTDDRITHCYRTRSSFVTDKDYGVYVEKTLRVGWRVLARVDYQNVKKGMTGIYYGTNGGDPPCLIVWDNDVKASSAKLPNVPPNKASHVYWVHWHQVEIVADKP